MARCVQTQDGQAHEIATADPKDDPDSDTEAAQGIDQMAHCGTAVDSWRTLAQSTQSSHATPSSVA